MDLLLDINHSSGLPLAREVSRAIEKAIAEKRLAGGAALPSARALARQYRLSVSTILRAYEDLEGQGIVTIAPRSGARVAKQLSFDCAPQQPEPKPGPEEFSRQLEAPTRLSTFCLSLLQADERPNLKKNAGVTMPGTCLVPTALWQRIVSKHKGIDYSGEESAFSKANSQLGYRPLREAICGLILRSRGIVCTPEQVVVSSAMRLDIICRLLLDPGDRVALENPSYAGSRRIMLSHGATLESIDIDQQGLKPEALSPEPHHYKMLYLTPSHQDPTGVALSMERRYAILDWAKRTDTVIFENDFDCNHFYTSAPVPALKAQDRNDCVIYSGSFWLTMGPLVSSGFLVLPEKYLPAAEALLGTVLSELPHLENRALAEFIATGHLERYLHKQREHFSSIRQTLIYQLTRSLRGLVEIGESSSTHIIIRLDPTLEAATILNCATSAGLILKPTNCFYTSGAPINEFIVPFAELNTETLASVIEHFAWFIAAVE